MLKAKGVELIGATEQRLISVWSSMGLKREDVEERETEVLQHVEKLLEAIATQEEASFETLAENVSKYKIAVKQLAEELATPSEIDEDQSLIDLEEELETTVQNLQKIKESRLEKIVELEGELESLETALEIDEDQSMTASFSGDVTVDYIEKLETKVSQYATELDDRKKTVKELQQVIARLCFTLEKPFDVDEEAKLSPQAIRSLQRTVSELEKEKEIQSKLRDEILGEIQEMWDFLEVEEERQLVFLEAVAEKCGKATITKCEVEISQLQDECKENMQKVIQRSRKKLVELWDKCYIGPRQREMFTQGRSELYDEDCLHAHEKEISRLTKYHKSNVQIFRLVERREATKAKLRELDCDANTVDRLTNRGGALLKEEKFRRVAARDLPKLEAELKEKVSAWEAKHDQWFMVNDERYVEMIANEKRVEEERKAELKAEKQKAKQKQIEEELIYGTKGRPKTPKKNDGGRRTPKKRAGAATPRPTTPKRRALQNLNKDPLALSSVKKHLSSATAPDSPFTGSIKTEAHTGYLREDISNLEGISFSDFQNAVDSAPRSSNAFLQ